MKVTISHEFNTDAETFWTKLFFDPEYNRSLYIGALKFLEYEVLENTDRGSQIFRRVRATPKQDAPAVVQKLVGGRFSYVEEGTFDKASNRYKLRVMPGALGDKLRSEGELRIESLGAKKVKRVAELSIEVKIFGVGGVVEGFISKSLQDSYAQAAVFTNQWIAQKGL